MWVAGRKIVGLEADSFFSRDVVFRVFALENVSGSVAVEKRKCGHVAALGAASGLRRGTKD